MREATTPAEAFTVETGDTFTTYLNDSDEFVINEKFYDWLVDRIEEERQKRIDEAMEHSFYDL